MGTWIALLGAGILCGFLNAAASSGSAISLPLLLALVLLMLKPQRWLRDGDPCSSQRNPSLALLVITAGVGLWTGLIVLDSATYLLMSLVLVGGLALGTNARLWIYRLLIAALALELGAMVLGWQHPAMRMMQI
jgi:hypothetical protein